MELRETVEASPRRAPAYGIPRLSRRLGFWAVAFIFTVVTAFSTAPSSLYGLLGHRDDMAPLTITFVYAIDALGVVTSLLLAGPARASERSSGAA
jgi:hypothetical protein